MNLSRCAMVLSTMMAALIPLSGSQQAAQTVRWTADLDYLARELVERHVAPATERSIAEFKQDVAQLRGRLAGMPREVMVLEFARLAASFGDGHTELPLAQENLAFHRVPIGLYFFGAELRVIAAAPAHEDLLGLRITTIAGHDVPEVVERLKPFIADDAGNPYEWLHSAPGFVTIPEVLFGARLAATALPSIAYEFERDDGSRLTRIVPALTMQEAARSMTERFLKPEQEALYQRRRDVWQVAEPVEQSDLLYVRVSRSRNQSGHESLAAFARRVKVLADAPGVRRVVVDVRQNTGGNFHTTEPLVAALCGAARTGKITRVYVILGRHTYSAAVVLAAQLRHGCAAAFVGEVPRAVPNRQADVESFRLPNSRLEVTYSSRLRQPFPELGAAAEIPLDLPAPPDWASFRAGRDPALEAILRIRELQP